MFPALKIAGVEPSKFRAVQPGEDAEIADRIRASGARLVLVGLGCPRQEVFAYAMRPLLDMPLMAVGAAFDYHAGLLRKPPPWMQRAGLEWLWRLGLEPKRLWRRYVLLNPAYLARLAGAEDRPVEGDAAGAGHRAAGHLRRLSPGTGRHLGPVPRLSRRRRARPGHQRPSRPLDLTVGRTGGPPSFTPKTPSRSAWARAGVLPAEPRRSGSRC